MTAFADNPVLRHYWWSVARSVDVTDVPMSAPILGDAVVLWRTTAGVHVLRDRCAHREAPLSQGRVLADGCLQCPYHGWVYDGTGRCVMIPSQGPGPAKVGTRGHVPAPLVAERYGLVWVCLDEPHAGIVDIPDAVDPAFRAINVPFYDSPVSATRLAENFLDAAHFAFVHAGTFGGETDPRLVVDPTDDGETVSYRFQVSASNPPEAFSTTGQTIAVLTRTMTMRITLPFTLVNTIDYDDGLRHIILNALTPVSDTETHWSMTLIRNDDHGVPEMVAAGLDLRIVAEDLAMLSRIPGPLPLDPSCLAHVGADRAAVAWMRSLGRLLEGGQRR